MFNLFSKTLMMDTPQPHKNIYFIPHLDFFLISKSFCCCLKSVTCHNHYIPGELSTNHPLCSTFYLFGNCCCLSSLGCDHCSFNFPRRFCFPELWSFSLFSSELSFTSSSLELVTKSGLSISAEVLEGLNKAG